MCHMSHWGFWLELRWLRLASDSLQWTEKLCDGEKDETGEKLWLPTLAAPKQLADHYSGAYSVVVFLWPKLTFKGGTITNERTTPKEMMFNKSSSFNLMFGGEQFTQDYSCSKVLSETQNEAMFQLFSQSQVHTGMQAGCLLLLPFNKGYR